MKKGWWKNIFATWQPPMNPMPTTPRPPPPTPQSIVTEVTDQNDTHRMYTIRDVESFRKELQLAGDAVLRLNAGEIVINSNGMMKDSPHPITIDSKPVGGKLYRIQFDWAVGDVPTVTLDFWAYPDAAPDKAAPNG